MLLTVAAIFAVAMAVSAVSVVAAPNCAQVTNNKNCVETTSTSTTTTTTGPGNSENTPATGGNNPNIRTSTSTSSTFEPGTPGGG
jgi:hypothetical protein